MINYQLSPSPPPLCTLLNRLQFLVDSWIIVSMYQRQCSITNLRSVNEVILSSTQTFPLKNKNKNQSSRSSFLNFD